MELYQDGKHQPELSQHVIRDRGVTVVKDCTPRVALQGHADIYNTKKKITNFAPKVALKNWFSD